jgi:type VI secretion system protein ImpC
MSERIFLRKRRVRPPRVHISYELELDGGLALRELPFVVGVLADLSGHPRDPLPRLADRRFVEIANLDDFEGALASVRPRLAFEVPDILGGAGMLPVELSFQGMRDFEPEAVVEQIAPLRELLEGPKREDEMGDLVSRQIDAVLHHPDFQALEASWCGLRHLVTQTDDEQIRVRVLDVSKRALARDFEVAAELTESALDKLIYEAPYGAYGGDPFGVIIGDYAFGKSYQDVSLLSSISQVAARSLAPFIAAASPAMFGLESFRELPNPRDLARIFDRQDPQNTRWLSFRDSEDSRWIALTVPRIVLRRPHEAGANARLCYAEGIGSDGQGILWGNAAFAYAACLTNAFAKYHWCAQIRGPEGGGLIEDLPWIEGSGDAPKKQCTEVVFPDYREMELSQLGFIPICQKGDSDLAVVFSARSCHRPKVYDLAEATASATLITQLPCLLTTSRFAHYVKAIARDRIGSLRSPGECELVLNRWLSNYVLSQTDASLEMKAHRPLREAVIRVTENEAIPGTLLAHLHLRPHFQVEELGVSLRQVVELPSPAL